MKRCTQLRSRSHARRVPLAKAVCLILTCAVTFGLDAQQAWGGMIVHFSGRIHNVVTPAGQPIHQYIANGDTFSGSFVYDPATSPSSLTSPALTGGLSGGSQYNSAVTAFTLKFRSGQSQGHVINGVVNSRNDYGAPVSTALALANNVQYGGSGPQDVARGQIALPDQQFRPGLNPVFFHFDWVDPTAGILGSANLADWDPNSAAGINLNLEQQYLVFQTAGDIAQPAVIRFSSVWAEPWEEPTPVQEQQAINNDTTEATFFGGATASSPGGLSVQFESPPDVEGQFLASYATHTTETLTEALSQASGFDLANFATGAGGQYQLWDLDFDGTLNDGSSVTLQFRYDDAGLSEAAEANLGIWHYGKYGIDGSRQWKWLRDSIDTNGNVITVTVDNFSPLVTGVQSVQAVPEPASLLTWSLLIGLPTLLVRKRQVRGFSDVAGFYRSE